MSYANKLISKAHDTKFLDIHIGNILSWKIHIEQILHTLSAACCAVRSVKPYTCQKTLKMVYYAYFHSTMAYRIIYWGNYTYSINILKIQKKAIRIVAGSRSADHCRDLFKNLKNLPPHPQYTLSLLLLVLDNTHNLNSYIPNINTKQKLIFHQPSPNLSLYQTGVHCFGIKMFNNLPQCIKKLIIASNLKQH
jgi:hypothetical protein